MAPIVLDNVWSIAGGYDFTCDSNQARLELEAEAVDKTVFCSGGWREVLAGLKSTAFNLAGFWESAATQKVDPEIFSNLGVGNEVFSFGPIKSAGQPAYLFRGLKQSYSLLGEVGAAAPFALGVVGSDTYGVARGKYAGSSVITGAAQVVGAGQQLTAVSATQALYVHVHVTGTPTSVTLKIQSDDNGGFSTPTDLQTLTAITTASGVWVRIPGSITDSFFRVISTAGTGSNTVFAALAVA